MKKKYPMSEFTGLHLILNYPSPSVDSSENVKKGKKTASVYFYYIFNAFYSSLVRRNTYNKKA